MSTTTIAIVACGVSMTGAIGQSLLLEGETMLENISFSFGKHVRLVGRLGS